MQPLRDRAIRNGRRQSFALELAGDVVPATLLMPTAQPAPAALLLHGWTSHKDRMADNVGPALLEQGIAALAIDLPLHGEREGRLDQRSLRNPMLLLRRWQLALEEASLALRWLAERPGIDPNRLAVVGYSLGSFIGVIAASNDPSVRAVVVAAGGDLPADLPFGAIVRRVADPLRAVRRLDGRPLLVVHGTRDRTVTPSQARRLFDAAEEPKEILWFPCGHRLTPPAIDKAAEWLAKTLRAPVRRSEGRSARRA